MSSKSDQFKSIAEGAAEKTREVLNKEISSLSKKMSEADIKKFAPNLADKAKLAKLMSIVSERTGDNRRAAKLIQNMGELGELVVGVLRKTIV